MATSVPTPTIDYTNKDFQALRRAMLELARFRLPEWTDQSPSDLGAVLVDLFAYMGDIVLYYQDRIANESFLGTAVERRSVLNLLRLVGYELAPPVPSSVELTLLFKPPPTGSSPIVTVPSGAQFQSVAASGNAPLTFEYLGPDLSIDLTSDQVSINAAGKRVYVGLPVLQSLAQPTVVIGSSTGEPNQSFAIPSNPVILDTLVVEVNEGAGWVEWDRVTSLLFNTDASGRVTLSNAEARDYFVEFDENDVCFVNFGDGTYGRRPPVGFNNIRATYRIGGGAAGNVPVASITNAKTTIPLLDSVTNPLPAAGGADDESIDHGKQFGPLAFRSGQRAVTSSDYVALAQQAGGVAKVRAAAPNWNTVELYVAPVGDSLRPVPEELRRRLTSFFEDKRMAGTFVEILDAAPAPINISIEIVHDRRFRPEAVRQTVIDAVNDLLAFNNVDFGLPLYLSDVYGKVEVLPGVAAMTVTRFRRADSTTPTIAAQLQQLGISPSAATSLPLSAALSRAFDIDVAADGRISIQQFELPVLGDLVVDISDTLR
jgi:hypothetical protein